MYNDIFNNKKLHIVFFVFLPIVPIKVNLSKIWIISEKNSLPSSVRCCCTCQHFKLVVGVLWNWGRFIAYFSKDRKCKNRNSRSISLLNSFTLIASSLPLCFLDSCELKTTISFSRNEAIFWPCSILFSWKNRSPNMACWIKP